ncbi:MAG: enolase C-terminal domain-like protein, partial [Anaerolineae bacterium]
MRIEQVEIRYVRLPLKRHFETSFRRTQERHTVLVTVWADGVEGWGESPVEDGPWFSGETVETAWHVLRDFLIPMMLGQEIERAADAFARMGRVRGHPMAKTGLEEALWDVEARQKGLPLARLLGGVRERILSGVSVGIQDTLPELLEQVEGYLAQGYRRVKVKIKPGWDVDVVRELRRRWPTVPLMADANSAYTLADTGHLAALDEWGLLMIEQ